MNWYGVLKVLHVLSAIVWLGGGVAFATVTAKLVRAADRATLKAMLPQVTGYMQTMAGPASGLVLLSGIAMVIVGHVGFKLLWINLGLIGIVLHGLFGGLVMRRRMAALEIAVAGPASDDALAQAGAGLRSANVGYLTLMAAIIAIMVLKPTL